MSDLDYFFRQAWRRSAGLEEEAPAKLVPSYESLARTEWSPKFERYMRNRLIMGAIRYGLLHAEGKPQYDRVESMVKRLEKYRATGSLELLVDVANLALLEFEECHHPLAHWDSEDDGEHVGRV